MDNKVNDEELQNIIFGATNDNAFLMEEESGDYYRILKTALATASPTTLPENFAQQITKKAIRKKHLYDLLKSMAVYLGVFAAFATFASFALFFLAKDVFDFLIKGVQNHVYPIVFGSLIFVLIQFLDELLVHKKITKFKID